MLKHNLFIQKETCFAFSLFSFFVYYMFLSTTPHLKSSSLPPFISGLFDCHLLSQFASNLKHSARNLGVLFDSDFKDCPIMFFSDT